MLSVFNIFQTHIHYRYREHFSCNCPQLNSIPHRYWEVSIGSGNCLVMSANEPLPEPIPDSKVHGANMGPTWVLSAPDGPHVGPHELLSGMLPQIRASYGVTRPQHYNDVIMTTMASEITSLTVVYSTLYSKKTSNLCVTGLCVGNSPGPVNSPHKGPVTRKMFPFDDDIMESMETY